MPAIPYVPHGESSTVYRFLLDGHPLPNKPLDAIEDGPIQSALTDRPETKKSVPPSGAITSCLDPEVEEMSEASGAGSAGSPSWLWVCCHRPYCVHVATSFILDVRLFSCNFTGQRDLTLLPNCCSFVAK